MSAAWENPCGSYHVADALEFLREQPDESVQMCVTSPPYWGLRNYSLGDQGIGLEATPELWVARLVEVFREVRRVLRKDGTLWLNVGDAYAGSGKGLYGDGQSHGTDGRKQRTNAASVGLPDIGPTNLKPKDLMGLPWMLAFALRADGWWLRSDVIWAKPNPMPESVTDRPTTAHEHIFLLAKAERYYYDADAIAERLSGPPHAPGNVVREGVVQRKDFGTERMSAVWGNPEGRNARTVWAIATHPFKGAHFATFPPELVRRCILAGSREGAVLLDPFMGSGTTALVAQAFNRRWLGCDLSPAYAEIARKRCGDVTLAMKLVGP